MSNDSATRRAFLGRAEKTALLALSSPFWLPRFASARGGGGGSQDVLVNIFLRGGMDGLTTCVPYGDRDLYTARPTLAVRKPGSGPGSAVDLDGFFGLAPGAASLLTPYQDGKLAIVHATGSTDPTRSHFDAMAFAEFGIPNQTMGSVDTGWLGRHLESVPPLGSGPLRGFTVGYWMPTSLRGGPKSIAVVDPANFKFPGDPRTAKRRRAHLEAMYGVMPDPLRSAALDGDQSIDLLATVDFANYQPENGASYPASYFGQGLLRIAAILKAGLGIETFTLDVDGWDTHVNQGPTDGTMNDLLKDLCDSLLAFYLDLKSAWLDKVVVMAMSEFGRRVAENASSGTDHGHGNCMLVMGGHVNGGQVLTKWPTLKPGKLDDGDLAITIDYRDIVGEILSQRMGDNSLDYVFPNYTVNFQGIVN